MTRSPSVFFEAHPKGRVLHSFPSPRPRVMAAALLRTLSVPSPLTQGSWAWALEAEASHPQVPHQLCARSHSNHSRAPVRFSHRPPGRFQAWKPYQGPAFEQWDPLAHCPFCY